MQVAELFALTRWIDAEIKEVGIADLYERLRAVLHSNAQPNNQQQPFETQKDELLSALAAVPLHALTLDQLTYLGCVGIAQHVGEAAVGRIEDFLFRNALDIATVLGRVEEALRAVQDGCRKSDEIKASLEDCVPSETELPDEILIRVSFTNAASISNIVDLKRWSREWHDIARGIAMAHGASPESIRVVGAGKGSIVVDLAVIYAIAKTVSQILLEALKVAERVFGIRVQAEEWRGLKLANEALADEMEAEAEKEKDGGAEAITQALVAETDLDPSEEGDKVAALRKSVVGLLDFLDQGGGVDCVIPDTDVEEGEDSDPELTTRLAELRASFQEIRVLDSSLKRLGPGGEGGTPDTSSQ